MSILYIGSQTTNSFVITGDGTGNLVIQTGNTATTAVTIDTSQNMGLGVTPSAWTGYRVFQIGSYTAIYSDGSSNELGLVQNAYYSTGWKYGVTGAPASWNYQYQGQTFWKTAPSGTAGNAITFTQAMTLDSSNRLLLGATSSYSSTPGQSVLQVTSGANPQAATFVTSSGSVYTPIVSWQQATTGFLAYFLIGGSNGTNCGSISYNGTLTLYTQTSDIRLKENIVDAGSGLAKLANVKIRSFDWAANGLHTDFGVVAQELQDVAPECVSIGQDNDDKTIKTPWSVDTSALVPAMIKAIQELSAQVTTLQTQVTALKG